MKLESIIWLLTTGLLLVSANAFAGDVNLLISRANRFFFTVAGEYAGGRK